MTEQPSRPAASRRTVACPSCGARVQWSPQSLFRPFCSQRCRSVDLGAWASESYRVADSGESDHTIAEGDETGQGN